VRGFAGHAVSGAGVRKIEAAVRCGIVLLVKMSSRGSFHCRRSNAEFAERGACWVGPEKMCNRSRTSRRLSSCHRPGQTFAAEHIPASVEGTVWPASPEVFGAGEGRKTFAAAMATRMGIKNQNQP